MTTWQMYWIVMLDNISLGVRWIGFLFFAVSCFSTLMWFTYAMEQLSKEATTFWKYGKFGLPLIAFSALLWASGLMIPNTKQMATILVVPKVVGAIGANKKLTGIPDKILDLADSWLTELGPKKKDEVKSGPR